MVEMLSLRCSTLRLTLTYSLSVFEKNSSKKYLNSVYLDGTDRWRDALRQSALFEMLYIKSKDMSARWFALGKYYGQLGET
jgi:hypothetical protein